MSYQFLCPLAQATVNGVVTTQPKYAGQFGITSFACIPYGGEGTICVLSLPSANPLLSAQADVYTFGDLTQPINDEQAAELSGIAVAANLPDDGILSGNPGVVGLLYILRVFLLAQAIFGSTGQPIFAGTGATLVSPASSSPAISAMISATSATAQPSQSTQGVGNVGTGVGTGVGVGSGGSSSSDPAPFNFTGITDGATVAEFLDATSQTWAGGPISLGGFA